MTRRPRTRRLRDTNTTQSAEGATRPYLRKVGSFKNRENTHTDFEQIIKKRFTEFENEMINQFNSRQDELKKFLGDTLAISILGAQKKNASKKKKVNRKGSGGTTYGGLYEYIGGRPVEKLILIHIS